MYGLLVCNEHASAVVCFPIIAMLSRFDFRLTPPTSSLELRRIVIYAHSETFMKLQAWKPITESFSRLTVDHVLWSFGPHKGWSQEPVTAETFAHLSGQENLETAPHRLEERSAEYAVPGAALLYIFGRRFEDKCSISRYCLCILGNE